MSPRSSSRNYSVRDIKYLFGKAASRCAECKAQCHVEATENDGYVITGKIAHIVASSEDGPRGDPNFAAKDRDKYPNLILLCGNCHDKIDGQPNTFTTEYLIKSKLNHEAWVEERLEAELAEIQFSELDVLLTALGKQDAAAATDGFNLTPPAEKIKKNDLSVEVQNFITIGMIRQEDIEGLLSDMAKFDDSLPDRITSRFKEEYANLLKEGLAGDELFHRLLDFACLGSSEFSRRSLGLVVLTHLFVICEVFEP